MRLSPEPDLRLSEAFSNNSCSGYGFTGHFDAKYLKISKIRDFRLDLLRSRNAVVIISNC